MRITDEQLVEWLVADSLHKDMILDLQEARAKIIKLEESLDLANYLMAENLSLEIKIQALEHGKESGKITNLEASLTVKDYLIAELQMQVQALEYRKEKLCATQGQNQCATQGGNPQ